MVNRKSLESHVTCTEASLADNQFDEPDFKVGDIILTCKPFVHILVEPMSGRLCDMCLLPPNRNRFNKSQPLRKCADCNQIYFCHSCLTSKVPNTFKTNHILECPFLAKYGSLLSFTSKLFLRLYLRLTNAKSFEYQTYKNPLTKVDITFETLVPRLVLNSKYDLTENIKNFCDKYNVKLNKHMETSCESNIKQKNLEKITINEIEITDNMTVDELSILQFIRMISELNQCGNLLSMVSDDCQIYQLWTMFVRLWSYTTPIRDETITGLFKNEAIAYGLYLEPNAIINGNSCEPNCAFVHYGSIVQLRAMKNIYQCQWFTVNLADISASRTEFCNEMKKYFISDCYCDMCIKNTIPSDDLEKFFSLKTKFISSYCEDLFPDLENRNMSILAIQNLSSIITGGTDESNEQIDLCFRLHEMCEQLKDYYDQIYPYNHPEKSRFLFAYLVIGLNRLLYKLELRPDDSISKIDTGDKPVTLGRVSDVSEFMSSATELDSLTNDIQQWSELLKITVRNIRWTHGIDHNLFRNMRIPLLAYWNKSLSGKCLTLSDLHSDPTIIMRILSSANRSTFSDSFMQQMDSMTGQLKQLIGENIGEVKSVANCFPIKIPGDGTSFYGSINILLRTLLVIFSVLFPLFVYYSIYVEDF
ncbi:hypothetical protein RDWZM_000509 [Blomia tropicalis]|uniref:Uncharacterized protein n=1 Tax=Blomia tropicalis TaxID=40697 RepID=A0A9Q0RPN0_BLOTA|nr:hypothetical protein RDWZM_000509 [Blomia tropicalis]